VERRKRRRLIPGTKPNRILRSVQFHVDGHVVDVTDPPAGASLLDVLREHVRALSVKDGCSPQGQCGCCTVLVDGAPRVACVTPAARVAGRAITTVDGLDEPVRDGWAEAFLGTGGSQCGFCTPGIVLRLEGLRRKGTPGGARAAVDQALLAHLCRCTGWQTIREAYDAMAAGEATPGGASPGAVSAGRDLEAAARRATLEGRAPQRVGADVVLGRGGFADDTAPADALVAMPRVGGGWAVAGSGPEARRLAGKVQGRRSTVGLQWPVAVPPGEWDLVLRTTWVEPAYLEPDAAWCRPGEGTPEGGPLANGGAFGGKVDSPLPAVACELAAGHGRAVRALWAREDVVRSGPKRPPLAAGLRADGTGVVRVVRTPGVAAVIREVLPGVEVEEVDVPGPPTSLAPRAAGWAEATVLRAALAALHRVPRRGETMWNLRDAVTVVGPEGGRAEVGVDLEARRVEVRVSAGDPLDDTVLRSYCIGAVHQALGWVLSEGIAVDGNGEPLDLTIRSFGILRAADMPDVHVAIEPGEGPPVPVADSVFAATAAATWIGRGLPEAWPLDRT